MFEGLQATAIDTVAKMAVRGSVAHRVRDLDEVNPSTSHVWNPQKGEVETYKKETPKLYRVAGTLDAFADLLHGVIGKFKGDLPTTICVGVHGARAVLNPASVREDIVEMPFIGTKPWNWLFFHGQQSQVYDLDDFIELTRHTLHGCLSDDFVEALRTFEVSFKSRQKVETGNSRHGMSSEATRSLTTKDGADMPDTMLVRTPIFEQFPDIVAEVNCALIYDTNDGVTVEARPLPGEIHREMAKALDIIKILIEGRINDAPDLESAVVYVGPTSE